MVAAGENAENRGQGGVALELGLSLLSLGWPRPHARKLRTWAYHPYLKCVGEPVVFVHIRGGSSSLGGPSYFKPPRGSGTRVSGGAVDVNNS